MVERLGAKNDGETVPTSSWRGKGSDWLPELRDPYPSLWERATQQEIRPKMKSINTATSCSLVDRKLGK